MAAAGAPRGSAASVSVAGWRSAWRAIERAWLGVVSPPLDERFADAGWRADDPAAYCGRCGGTVGPGEADADGCAACRSRALQWQRAVRLGEYSGVLRDVVHDVKFTAWRRVGSDLGRMLGRAIAAALDSAGIPRERAVIVPVPTTFRRRMERGIDHALVLARGASATAGVRIARALQREHRPSQLAVPLSKRAANVAGSIRLRWDADLGGRVVIVLDDVRTTGATLATACRAIADGRRRGPRAPSPPRDGPPDPPRPTAIWTAVAAVTPREK